MTGRMKTAALPCLAVVARRATMAHPASPGFCCGRLEDRFRSPRHRPSMKSCRPPMTPAPILCRRRLVLQAWNRRRLQPSSEGSTAYSEYISRTVSALNHLPRASRRPTDMKAISPRAVIRAEIENGNVVIRVTCASNVRVEDPDTSRDPMEFYRHHCGYQGDVAHGR